MKGPNNRRLVGVWQWRWHKMWPSKAAPAGSADTCRALTRRRGSPQRRSHAGRRAASVASCASYPVSRRTGPLPAPGPQRPPTGLPRVLLRLCSTRYVWRKHPRLRMIEFNFISLYWPSLPNGIQAAYEDFDRDLIFVFKGNCPRLSSSFSSWWREGQEAFVLFSRFKEMSQGESVDADCVFVERPGLGPLFTTNCCVNFSRLYPLQALISSFTK